MLCLVATAAFTLDPVPFLKMMLRKHINRRSTLKTCTQDGQIQKHTTSRTNHNASVSRGRQISDAHSWDTLQCFMSSKHWRISEPGFISTSMQVHHFCCVPWKHHRHLQPLNVLLFSLLSPWAPWSTVPNVPSLIEPLLSFFYISGENWQNTEATLSVTDKWDVLNQDLLCCLMENKSVQIM